MRIGNLPFPVAVLALVCLLLFSPTRGYADTYAVTGSLFYEAEQGFYGLDSSGDLYLSNFDTGTFSTLLNGNLVSTSSIRPSFISDRGTFCSEIVPGLASPVSGICNDGRFAYLLGGASASLYMYSGTGAPQLITAAPYGDLMAMNSLGDIIFDNGFVDLGFEAIDTAPSPAPEPSSLLLLGTAALALGGTLLFRRRQLTTDN